MNKEELVSAVATKTKQSKVAVKDVIDTALDAISAALKKGERVTLVGFGTFGVRKRAARTVRNIRTGEPIKVPAKKVPYFKPGGELKGKVK